MMALASTQMKAGELDSALANYNKAATLCTKFNYELGLAQLYADLGLLLQSLGQFAEAEQMLLKSFTVAEGWRKSPSPPLPPAILACSIARPRTSTVPRKWCARRCSWKSGSSTKTGSPGPTSISARSCSKSPLRRGHRPFQGEPASLPGAWSPRPCRQRRL